MFATIIAPLDGSVEAEQRFLQALTQLQPCEATLVLLTVIPRPEPIDADGHTRGGPVPLVCVFRTSEIEQEVQCAQAYLDRLQKRLALGFPVETVVRVGEPVHQIQVVAHWYPNPLLMVAAGSCRGRALQESVAQRLTRETDMPALIIPPEDVPSPQECA
ncbi:MAG: universal stress protein [Thermomicrobiales bacterium]